MVESGKEVPQPKLFDSWFAVQSANQAVPFLAPEHQALLLAVLSNRNEPGVYLAWTKIAGDDWAGNGAWISFLESVVRQRRTHGTDSGVPTDKERWTALDMKRMRHALEGFANSAALELDDLNKRKRQGIQTAEDGTRRRQVEMTSRRIASLLAAFPRPGSWIFWFIKVALRLLVLLVIFIFGTSVLSNAFPRLMKMRLKPDAPLIKDLNECNGVHGQTWCTARDRTMGAVKASRDSVGSIVGPAYEAHVQPLVNSHVKPLYEGFGAPLVRKASEYLPHVQKAVAPVAAVAGAGALYGVSWLEEAADGLVKWVMKTDWSKVSAEGIEAAGQTMKLVRRKTEEGWELAKPHVVAAKDQVGAVASDLYGRAMEVPTVAQVSSVLQDNVAAPAGKAWGAVRPALEGAAGTASKGAKAAYLRALRRQPTNPGETWDMKIAEHSMWDDVTSAWDWTKGRAAISAGKASGYLSKGGDKVKQRWYTFVTWLEDSVGIEFGQLDEELQNVFTETTAAPPVKTAAADQESIFSNVAIPAVEAVDDPVATQETVPQPTPEVAKSVPAEQWETFDDLDTTEEEIAKPAFEEPSEPAQAEEAPQIPETTPEPEVEEQQVDDPVTSEDSPFDDIDDGSESRAAELEIQFEKEEAESEESGNDDGPFVDEEAKGDDESDSGNLEEDTAGPGTGDEDLGEAELAVSEEDPFADLEESAGE